ncbi:MAG TPA: type I-C CRISPR-associated protein Cas5c [Clostridia bacterium]|nr:type I-C CRISPR-associated protein Cas5c [Clostridia bacterium]
MFGIKILVKGDYACFTRPEMKVERVSYDVPTPSAMRGLIESIYWKPGIQWIIDKIHVINPINFINIRRNEVKSKLSYRDVKRQMEDDTVDISIYRGGDNINQRASLILKDVVYGLEAHFEMTGAEGSDADKHYAIATRRIKNGQYVKVPVLGCREFPASVEWVEGFPESRIKGRIDLGYMLYDMKFNESNNVKQYSDCATPIWYRPIMEDGIIDVKKYFEETGVNK